MFVEYIHLTFILTEYIKVIFISNEYILILPVYLFYQFCSSRELWLLAVGFHIDLQKIFTVTSSPHPSFNLTSTILPHLILPPYFLLSLFLTLSSISLSLEDPPTPSGPLLGTWPLGLIGLKYIFPIYRSEHLLEWPCRQACNSRTRNRVRNISNSRPRPGRFKGSSGYNDFTTNKQTRGKTQDRYSEVW